MPGSSGEERLTNYLHFGAIRKSDLSGGRGKRAAMHIPKHHWAFPLIPAHLQIPSISALLANYSGTKLWVSALEFNSYLMDLFIKEGMSLFFQDCKPSLQHLTHPCHLPTPGTHGRPCHSLRALKFPRCTAKHSAGLDHRLLGLNTFSLEKRKQNTDLKQMLPVALSISTFSPPLYSPGDDY